MLIALTEFTDRGGPTFQHWVGHPVERGRQRIGRQTIKTRLANEDRGLIFGQMHQQPVQCHKLFTCVLCAVKVGTGLGQRLRIVSEKRPCTRRKAFGWIDTVVVRLGTETA